MTQKLKHNEKSSISKNYGELQQPHILKIRNISIIGLHHFLLSKLVKEICQRVH